MARRGTLAFGSAARIEPELRVFGERRNWLHRGPADYFGHKDSPVTSLPLSAFSAVDATSDHAPYGNGDFTKSWRLCRPNGGSGICHGLGSYRIATAPEPNSSRLTSFKSTCFDSPANNVGPWPASLGCTTKSYSSINPNSANASGSVTPPTNSPLPDSRLSC